MTSAKEKPSGWYALDVDIDAAAHEAVEYALMEAGALGTETTDRGVTAYFAETPSRERVRTELFEALRIYDLPSFYGIDTTYQDFPVCAAESN